MKPEVKRHEGEKDCGCWEARDGDILVTGAGSKEQALEWLAQAKRRIEGGLN